MTNSPSSMSPNTFNHIANKDTLFDVDKVDSIFNQFHWWWPWTI